MTTGTFTLTGFDEDTLEESPTKVTQATIGQTWHGDGLDGEVVCRNLMHYADDKTATIVGLLRFTGSVDGRQGSFVAQTTGTYDGSTMSSDLVVTPGSGTGDLAGLSGSGTFAAPNGPEGTWNLTVS